MNSPRATLLFAWLGVMLLLTAAGHALRAEEPEPLSYNQHVAPLFRKYCVSCHNTTDQEGKLVLDSYAGLLQGGAHGSVVTVGHADLSRIVRVLTGAAKPAMPPEGSEAPSGQEIARLKAWIDAGAAGPDGAEPDLTLLVTPMIKPTAEVRREINDLAVSSAAEVAIAGFGTVELSLFDGSQPVRRFEGHRGSVNAVSFSSDARRLVAAGGEPGLFGEVRLWDVQRGELLRVLRGHQDSLYAARLSPDGRLLATAGYDQEILIWDVERGEVMRSLSGHNGAVLDLAFHPNGWMLASASGDRTVKLWNVTDGARLDTLNQSLKELYTLAFSPHGQRLAAGGVDNRIRVWQISESGREGTNPLLESVYAHEAAIVRLVYSRDGQTLVTLGEDHLVKVWDAGTMSLRQKIDPRGGTAPALALSPDQHTALVGRWDGSLSRYELRASRPGSEQKREPLAETPPLVDYGEQPSLDQLPQLEESEPNDQPASANEITTPGTARGRIFAHRAGQAADIDLFRFQAKAGEQWIVETKAAQDGSPLDSKIAVLDEAGHDVPRLLLRAVRDSEIEFRGVNSEQRGARLKNWEEMLLDEYVYINGEVLKHFQQRRGPDSDSQFYPDDGSRITYFETTPRAHPLGQPCYVVVPYAMGTVLPDNGLPVFTLNIENDDEAQRKLGKDSRLTFVAPQDGTYLIRVEDVRGFEGEDYRYQLIVRRPHPDFTVKLVGDNPTVNPGSGKSFTLKAERIDNFNGPIQVDIAGLPPGFVVTTPITIQEGHFEAKGVVNALPGAVAPAEEAASATSVTATARIAGKTVTHDVNNLGKLQLGEEAKLLVRLLPGDAETLSADAATPDDSDPPPIPEVVIVPGSRTTCLLKVERKGFDDRIQFAVENLPHGVIVDDIGLNGVLIPEGKTQRTLFLAAEPWVPETSRLIHATAQVEGNQASFPILLRVRRTDRVVAGGAPGDEPLSPASP